MNKNFNNTFSYKLIYVFGIPDKLHEGLLKIGEATVQDFDDKTLLKDNSEMLIAAAIDRIDNYTKTAGIRYELFYTTLAITNNGMAFKDNDVHNVLERSGIAQPKYDLNGATEWYKCDLETAKKAINAVKEGKKSLSPGDISYLKTPIIFRPEQKDAIERTIKVFKKGIVEKENQAHMLWNAKMRFGKTLSALEVTKKMQFDKTLIITHRPVVKKSWFDDFDKIFYDQKNYIYGSREKGETLENLIILSKNQKKIIYFESIQYSRLAESVGGRLKKNDNLFKLDWDFIIIDEAHEGTQTLLGNEVIQSLIESTYKTKALYLSGTPFNLIGLESRQSFKNEEVFTWDYVDEQTRKRDWVIEHFGDSNPYESLPKMNIYTYDLASIIPKNKYQDIEDTAFNFKEFFKVWTGNEEIDKLKKDSNLKVGTFIHDKDVKRFLDLLIEKGEHNYPFSTNLYRENFRHTLWMLPGVKEAKAMSQILKAHNIFQHFTVVNVAGDGDEEVKKDDALRLVLNAISDKPEETRTITLSCGRLTTGVTVPAWSAVLMLSGSSSTSPSSYLQTIFRVQTPATIEGRIKTNCFVFDFAPDRTLKMVAEAGKLSTQKGATNDDRKKMEDFLNFCPVIGIHGSEMKPYDTENMMIQLKRAYIDRVARNGFDDRNLYNDNLLELTELEIAKFQDLKKILKSTNTARTLNDILINNQGLDGQVREEPDEKTKRHLTKEEKAQQEERRKKQRERSSAIAILRGIAIRIPLLVYGAEIGLSQKIDVNNFTQLIDDKSWIEFMPKGVTKKMFGEFSKYFDNEIFVEAGLKIRRQAKAADELGPLERVQAIADLFATFKNPDRETVLTPWRAVNMHLGECIGGANFYEDNYEKIIRINDNTSARWVDKNGVTNNIFTTDSQILEINSKTGLYPLYCAISIYQKVKIKGQIQNVNNLWRDILENNIFAICRTKMAKAITERTLRGFRDKNESKTNVFVIEDIAERMSQQYHENYKYLVNQITNGKTWEKGANVMKFNAVVGNPPYQSDAKQQIYTDFYLLARELGDVVSLIFPVGWQEPKTANNLSKLNNLEIKGDKQIVFIDNRQNVFPGISGAEWTNFILWKKGHDNKLEGNQKVYINGKKEQIIKLLIEKSEVEKPLEIIELANKVTSFKSFYSMIELVSSLKPYGLRTDFFDNPSKYNLPAPSERKSHKNDLKIYGLKNRRQVELYIPFNYPLPKLTKSLKKYKVFVGKAWGNWSDNYLGGSYSDVIVGLPNELCTENFLEVGPFDNVDDAHSMAKYLLTSFLRGLLFMNKYSQDNSKEKFLAVPLQQFKEKWWKGSISSIDENLFIKYGLNGKIIDYLKINIQSKSEDNIIFKTKSSNGK
jgi:superfamily II DNA or RNA helicase